MDSAQRYKVVVVLTLVGSLVLMANLINHQILNSTYRSQAQNRTLTKETVTPSRGLIYDRNNDLIVVNEPTYELEVIFNEIDEDMDLEHFCSLLKIEREEYDYLLQRVRSKKYFRKWTSMPFLSNIAPEDFARFQEHLYLFPGFYPILKSKRKYPRPHAAHLLGYISEVDAEDLELYPDVFDIGDVKGVIGLEKVYDRELRGTKGLRYLLKDNVGRAIEPYLEGGLDTAAVAGSNLFSTLDISLQAFGESLMRGKRGSIVAIEPASGEVLAMVSSPTYDPNQLSFGRQRNNTFLDLLSDTLNKPILNRSLQAKYPPGSIFKPILSLIALQEGTTYWNRSMSCSGEYVINERKGFSQGCRNHPRPYNIQTALQHSCNTYYYQLMRDFVDQFGVTRPSLGLNLLNKYLNDFALGRKTGIDLVNEVEGFIPTPAYFDKQYNTPEYNWRSTYILSIGIGQGELQLTTIQMANLAAIIANRGFYITPHLIRSEQNYARNTVPIDSVHFDPVIDGMERVITNGTGFRAQVAGLSICGKTGTSQNPHGIDHSVLFAFAPKENPKIAIAVYVENAGGGGAIAAPIGGLLIEQYLQKELSPYRKRVAENISNINLISIP